MSQNKKQILIPQNGNIIIKFKKTASEMKTVSGLFVVNVEQDLNVAEVVRLPPNRKYWYKVYDVLGTPIRATDGISIKEAVGDITVNIGDKVLIERRSHAEYDSGPERFLIPHCVKIPVEWEQFNDEEHDYYFIKFEDILGTYEGHIQHDAPFAELFPIAPAKPIKLKSR